MKVSVSSLVILWPLVDFGLCSVIPKTKLYPLPCWLVQGSRFHVCKDGWADDAGRPDVDAEDQVLDEPIEVNKRLAEYFKQLVKQSEKITSFSDPESTAVVDWFREAIKRAMAAIKDEKESTTYKRKFDSIAYHYRFGFGK